MNLSTIPTSTLVAAYNALTGAAIKKFENRSKAETRVAAALEGAGLDASHLDRILTTGTLPTGAVSSRAAAEVAPPPQAPRPHHHPAIVAVRFEPGPVTPSHDLSGAPIHEQPTAEDVAAYERMRADGTDRAPEEDEDFSPPAFLAKGRPSIVEIAAAVEEPAAPASTPGMRRLRAQVGSALLAEEARADQARAAAEAARERAAIAKETVAKAEAASAASPRTKLIQTQRIQTVVDNPKKPGSRAFARFALYRAGATVRDFIAACEAAGFPAKEAMADLSWDRRHGFITIE